MQKIILIGNLVRDPSMKTVGSSEVCGFTIAVNSKQSGKDKTDYYSIDVWGKSGESCNKFLKKGSKCAVIGDISYRDFQGRDGAPRISKNVHADHVEFLNLTGAVKSGPVSDKSAMDHPIQSKEEEEDDIEDDDDLPF